eukprot:2511976-Rhodomonas_salina.7
MQRTVLHSLQNARDDDLSWLATRCLVLMQGMLALVIASDSMTDFVGDTPAGTNLRGCWYQLSLGDITFAFYNTPRINSLENPYGPVQVAAYAHAARCPGGWKVLLRGNFFMDLPDMRCRCARVYGLRSMVYGLRSTVYGRGSRVEGLRSMFYGLRSRDQGHGLGSRVEGLGSRI